MSLPREGARSRALWLVIVVAAFVAACLPEAAAADLQGPDHVPWVIQGAVSSILPVGSHTFLGGVDYVGPYTGEGAALSVGDDSAPLTGFATVEQGQGSLVDASRATGELQAAVPDGGGGWYVAGGFARVGGEEREGLAHLLPDGSLDPRFRVDVGGVVATLVRHGSTLYVGGDFRAVGGQARAELAAVDTGTGQVTSWDPELDRGSTVLTMAIAGNTLYVGGYFFLVGDEHRHHLAAFDLGSGSLRDWAPDADGTVHAIATGNGVVYVGGDFNTVGGAQRYKIAALDPSTGEATPWSPGDAPSVADGTGEVTALAVDGSQVYVGGQFAGVGHAQRQNLAAVDATSGLATDWSPNPNSAVDVLTVAGGRLYVGGGFGRIAGATQLNLAAFDTATGQLSDWAPVVDGWVATIAVDGSTVYIGGAFTSVGGETRGGMLELDADGNPTSWNPGAGDGSAMQVSADGSTLYYTSQGGIRAVDTATGADLPFNIAVGTNTEVDAILLVGNTLYAGGNFWTIGGQSRAGLAAIDTRTGQVTAWDPQLAIKNYHARVYSLARSGSTVYAGGFFNTAGSETHPNVVGLSATTAAPTAFDGSTDGRVYALQVDGGRLYVGGEFSTVGGAAHEGIAALDAANGEAADWSPQLGGINSSRLGVANALTVHGHTLYVTGSFGSVDGVPRNKVASVSTDSGELTDFKPVMTGLAGYALGWQGDRLLLGGYFDSLGLSDYVGFGEFTDPTEAASETSGYELSVSVPEQGTVGRPLAVHFEGTSNDVMSAIVAFYRSDTGPCGSFDEENDDSRLVINGARILGTESHESSLVPPVSGPVRICAYMGDAMATAVVQVGEPPQDAPAPQVPATPAPPSSPESPVRAPVISANPQQSPARMSEARLSIARRATLGHGVLRVRLRCSGPGSCAGTVAVRRYGRRIVSKHIKLAAHATRTVTLRVRPARGRLECEVREGVSSAVQKVRVAIRTA